MHGASQSCLNSLKRSSSGYRPKFIDPMFSEATSGLSSIAGLSRSSTLTTGEPPVVILMTPSVRALILPTN